MIPKAVLHSELKRGNPRRGHPKLRYKGVINKRLVEVNQKDRSESRNFKMGKTSRRKERDGHNDNYYTNYSSCILLTMEPRMGQPRRPSAVQGRETSVEKFASCQTIFFCYHVNFEYERQPWFRIAFMSESGSTKQAKLRNRYYTETDDYGTISLDVASPSLCFGEFRHKLI